MFLSRDVFNDNSPSPLGSPSLFRSASPNNPALSLPLMDDAESSSGSPRQGSFFETGSLAQHVGSYSSGTGGGYNMAQTVNASGAMRLPSDDTMSVVSRPSTASSTLGGMSSSAAERRQKLLEQQRAQMQAKKVKALSSGMVRADSASPSRPTSASPTRPASGDSLNGRPPSSTIYSFRGAIGINTRSASPGPSDTLSNSSSTNSQAAATSPLGVGQFEDQGGTLRDAIGSRRVSNTDSDPTLSTLERDLISQGIQPIFEPGPTQKPEVKLDLSDMRSFLTQPVPRGSVVQCTIVRQNKGLANRMYPSYELFTKDDQFLMISKKRSKNKTSNYIMSMDRKDLEKTSPSYLGKLRANFVGTEFTIYDKGLSPKDVEKESLNVGIMTVRQELGSIIYESNILGSRGPRKMTVLLPEVSKDGAKSIFRPLDEASSMLSKFKSNVLDGLSVLHNKQPQWNDQFEAYVLNFNGRVTMASVKNFQLVADDDLEYIMLQFGRIAKDKFTMDVRWPLSPLQAFAICLSSFDQKLACE